MTTQQPIWTKVGTVGDINPIDYSGGFVYIDTTGVYSPELEWIESEDQHKAEATNWTVYRICLDRCSLTQHGLVPYGFDTRTDLPYALETYVEWFDKTLNSVCESHGVNPDEFKACLCSDQPMELAYAYLAMAEYHGWENFDSDPLTFTDRSELEKRYQDKNK